MINTIQSTVRVLVTDAQGNLVSEYDSEKPGTIKPLRSDAAAYYRRGRLTEDLFDRFRNFYLAIENISDQIRLLKEGKRVNGQKLLEIGLQETFKNNSKALRNIAQNSNKLELNKDLFLEVAQYLYKSHRCQLNHAKAKRDKKVPFNLQDEVARALLNIKKFSRYY